MRSCAPAVAMFPEAAAPSPLELGSILVLAAALVALGVAGGQWFSEADYVVYGYSVRGPQMMKMTRDFSGMPVRVDHSSAWHRSVGLPLGFSESFLSLSSSLSPVDVLHTR